MARRLPHFTWQFLACFGASALCAFAAQVDKIKDPNLPGGKGKWTDSGTWQGGGQVPNNSAGNSFNTQITSGTVEIDSEITITSLLLDTTGGLVTAATTTGNQGRKLTVAGKGSSWKSGSLLGTNGAGEFVISSTGDLSSPDLTITSASSKSLSNWTLRNGGSVLWDGGTLSSGNAAAINNEAGALFTTNFDGAIAYDLGGTRTTFTNAGTFTKSGGAGGRTEIQASFQNTGTLDASSGTLLLAGGGSSSGAVAIGSGAKLQIGGNDFAFTGGSIYGSAGRLELTDHTTTFTNTTGGSAELALVGGTAQFNGTHSGGGKLSLASGSATGSGSAAFGSVDWTGGTVTTRLTSNGAMTIGGTQSKVLSSGGELTLRGTTTWSAGSIDTGNAGRIVNDSSATFTTNFDGAIAHSQGGTRATFENRGTFAKNAGTGESNLQTTFTNSGTVQATSGTLRLSGGGSSSGGAFTAGAGSRIVFGSDFALSGTTLGGTGTISVTGATLNVAGGRTDVSGHVELSTGSALTGDGTLGVSGMLDWLDGDMLGAGLTEITSTGQLLLSGLGPKRLGGSGSTAGRRVQNSGVVTLSDTGTFLIGDGATFDNRGDFDIRSDTGIAALGTGVAGSITNSGILRKTAGTGTSAIAGVSFVNNAQVSAAVGTLSFKDAVTSNGGVFDAAPGASIQFVGASSRAFGSGSSFVGGGSHLISGGTTTFNGAFNAMHLTFAGGTLLGPATLTGSMQWSGGLWSGGDTFAVAPGSLLTIEGASAKQLIHGSASAGGRVISNQGYLVWDGTGSVLFGDGAQLSIAEGAVFEIRNDASLDYAGRGAPGAVVNAGTIIKSPTHGTTTIAQPFTQSSSGTLVVQTGTLAFTSTFTNDGGAILVSPGASLRLASPLNLGTGPLMGSGTISAPSVIAGGFVSPGSSPGALTLTGDLTLLSTSVLLVELGGLTQGVGYDFISVGGNALLAGHLAIDLVDGFWPAGAGETFTVLTASGTLGLSGMFANVAPGGRLLTSNGFGSFQVNYGATSAFGLNSVVLTNFQSVPEPSTWAMLGLGGAVILFGALRRTRRSTRR